MKARSCIGVSASALVAINGNYHKVQSRIELLRAMLMSGSAADDQLTTSGAFHSLNLQLRLILLLALKGNYYLNEDCKTWLSQDEIYVKAFKVKYDSVILFK